MKEGEGSEEPAPVTSMGTAGGAFGGSAGGTLTSSDQSPPNPDASDGANSPLAAWEAAPVQESNGGHSHQDG